MKVVAAYVGVRRVGFFRRGRIVKNLRNATPYSSPSSARAGVLAAIRNHPDYFWCHEEHQAPAIRRVR